MYNDYSRSHSKNVGKFHLKDPDMVAFGGVDEG